jgi:hypothetical protein
MQSGKRLVFLIFAVTVIGVAVAPPALADGPLPTLPDATEAVAPPAVPSLPIEAPPAPQANTKPSVASPPVSGVSRTARRAPTALPAASSSDATESISRTLAGIPEHLSPTVPQALPAEARTAAGKPARAIARNARKPASDSGRHGLSSLGGEPPNSLLGSPELLSAPFTSAPNVAGANAVELTPAGPGRNLPGPNHTGFPSGLASGAAPALLLLLLVLLIEGFAAAPPSLRRMLSLRRLAPASHPFLLELERPD